MNCYTNPSKWSFAGLVASLLFLAGCAGLGSMEKEIEAMGLEASPEPLILRGDQVELEVTGRFPAKYFGKKVSMEATPVLTWEGGSASFESEGSRARMPLATSRSCRLNLASPFPTRHRCRLTQPWRTPPSWLLLSPGTQGNKSATFEPFVVGAGVITTPLWVQADDQFIPVEDNFQRVITYTEEVTVNYSVNSSTVRSGELRDEDWKAVEKLDSTLR